MPREVLKDGAAAALPLQGMSRSCSTKGQLGLKAAQICCPEGLNRALTKEGSSLSYLARIIPAKCVNAQKQPSLLFGPGRRRLPTEPELVRNRCVCN